SGQRAVLRRRATSHAAILATRRQLGPERLPNPRVKLAPAGRFLAEVGHAGVQAVGRLRLPGDLLVEASRVPVQLKDARPGADEYAGEGDHDGQRDAHHMARDVEADDPGAVAADD